MKKYASLIFDLDGTLLDTSSGILSAVKELFEARGLPLLPDDQMRSFIGPPIEHTFITLDMSPDVAKDLAKGFRNIYFEKKLFDAEVFPNVKDLLKVCKDKGISLGVATNKRENYTITLLEYFGLAEFFDVIHGTDEKGNLTKTDIINNCLKDMSVSSSDALMVGDAWSDEVGAKEARVDFAAAMYGFGFNENSKIECVFKCYDPMDLTKLIGGL